MGSDAMTTGRPKERASNTAAPRRSWLDDVAELETDAARADYFATHPQRLSIESIAVLCGEVVRSVSIDLGASEALAGTCLWMADQLAHPPSQGLALRARANALHSIGDSAAAQQQYDAALAVFTGLGDPLESAITRSSALFNLAYLGRYDDVERWERQARQTFVQYQDRLRLANLANNFANVHYRQDRWDLALESYLTAFNDFLDLGRSENAAICLRNIAVCYISLHRFDEALRVYAQTRATCADLGLPRIALQVDYNIAYLYYLRGEYTRAIQLFQEARRRSVDEGDVYHRALCDLDQSEIYLELNLVEEAADLARSAHDGFRQLELPYESGKALTFHAIAESRLSRGERALDLLLQAHDIFRRERNHLWLALIDFYGAVILQRQRRSDEAIRKARLAHHAFVVSKLPFRTVMCELLLAQLLLAQGDPVDARKACYSALKRLQELSSPAFEHQAYFLLGQIEERTRDRAAALEAYSQSHRRLERLRSQLQGEDLKIAFLEDKQGVYESLVWLTLQEEPSPARDVIAFDYIEKAKSRGLAELLSFQAHALPAKTADRSDLVDNVRRLREELSWLYRQQDQRQLEGSLRGQADLQKLHGKLQQKENALLRSLRELQTADLEYSSLQAGGIVDPQLALASIPTEATLVEFFIARDTVLVAVGHRRRLHIQPLVATRRIRELHRHLQFQLQRAQPGGHRRHALELGQRATDSYLRQLYDALIAPIRHRLRGEHLVIVPHGLLHHIPFHALMDGRRPLIDHFSISYAPSTGVFHLCASKVTRWNQQSLVLGVADERAPHILEEAQTVAASMPHSTLLLGEEANEEALRRHGAHCRFVHLATHGFFRRDNPMFSAIQLGTSRLSLFDLYDLRLEAEMVVLSGCGTGLNAVLGTEELVGLTRGLLYAGARSALVTLWDIHDASAAAFMGRFYQYLAQGSQRAEALRRTMRDQRAEFSHPYHWAPFILVGDPMSPSPEGSRQRAVPEAEMDRSADGSRDEAVTE